MANSANIIAEADQIGTTSTACSTTSSNSSREEHMDIKQRQQIIEGQEQRFVEAGHETMGLKEEFDSGDELPLEEEMDDSNIHEIRCGLLTAKLHMNRFTCPGIHRKCVEFEGKLISPRQFTIRAEKDKQKDWKGSIRLGKHNLRTLMEMKTLDFYEHATNCSLKCQSRNYIKNRKNEGSSLGMVSDQYESVEPSGMEIGESHDIKSITSSSSTASTRKSSTILEDYVSQTIPSMGTLSYAVSGTTAATTPEQHIFQQSPLKTLFGCGGASSGQITSPTTPKHHSIAHQHPFAQKPMQHQVQLPQQAQHQPFPTLNNNRQTAQAQPTETSPSLFSDDAALALLLQSLQASILMEQQQQKTMNATQQQQLNTINNNNNLNSGNTANLLTQLINLNNLQQQQQQTPPIIPGDNNNFNGVGKLLGRNGALLPPLQHRQQQNNNNGTAIKQEPIANIRKSMEENSTLFWSQMRNMGLLEDMLKTLSDTLEKLKQIYLTGGNAVSEEFAAQRLSSVALALDLCSLFGEKIHSRYIQATLESTLISKELLELQRKQEEQKRRLENAKRKSQLFDQLLKSNPAAGVTGNSNATYHHGANGGAENGTGGRISAPEMKKIHLNF